MEKTATMSASQTPAMAYMCTCGIHTYVRTYVHMYSMSASQTPQRLTWHDGESEGSGACLLNELEVELEPTSHEDDAQADGDDVRRPVVWQPVDRLAHTPLRVAVVDAAFGKHPAGKTLHTVGQIPYRAGAGAAVGRVGADGRVVVVHPPWVRDDVLEQDARDQVAQQPGHADLAHRLAAKSAADPDEPDSKARGQDGAVWWRHVLPYDEIGGPVPDEHEGRLGPRVVGRLGVDLTLHLAVELATPAGLDDLERHVPAVKFDIRRLTNRPPRPALSQGALSQIQLATLHPLLHLGHLVGRDVHFRLSLAPSLPAALDRLHLGGCQVLLRGHHLPVYGDHLCLGHALRKSRVLVVERLATAVLFGGGARVSSAGVKKHIDEIRCMKSSDNKVFPNHTTAQAGQGQRERSLLLRRSGLELSLSSMARVCIHLVHASLQIDAQSRSLQG